MSKYRNIYRGTIEISLVLVLKTWFCVIKTSGDFVAKLNEPLCVVRFMVDSDVVGCCWIELPKGKYKVREEKSMVEDTDSQYPGKVGLVHTLPVT